MAHGNPFSVLGLNATNALRNSHSSLFNSNNIMSELDSVGMSFGKATEVSHNHGQGLTGLKMHAGQANAALTNMNRQYKSDRNVFGARPSDPV